MKLAGISLLFLLCCGIGFRKARSMETRYCLLKAMLSDTESLLLWIRTRKMPLQQAAMRLPDGVIKTAAKGEENGNFDGTPSERMQLSEFLNVLQSGNGAEIAAAGEAFLANLRKELQKAEREREQSRLFRTLGALCGAVLAILLW